MRRLAAGILLGSLLLLPSPADTLVFKDGRRLEGQVLEEDATTVTFKMKSIVTKFKKDEIAQVIKGPVVAEPPKEDPEATVRAERTVPTGDEKIDKLRADAAGELDAVIRMKKDLAAAAKKTEQQTKAFESQLKKVKDAEAATLKAKDRWQQAMDRMKPVEDAATAARNSTGKVSDELQRELAAKKTACDSAQRASEAAQSRLEAEQKKLEEFRDKYQAAADTLKPAIASLTAALNVLDDAWGLLAAAERAQAEGPAAWWPAPPGAGRVRIEGRVVKAEGGSLTLARGTDIDPSKWTEEVTVLAPGGIEAKPGDLLLVTARRVKNGWIVTEVER